MQIVQDAYCRSVAYCCRMYIVAALLYKVVEYVLVLLASSILRLFSFALFVIALSLVFPFVLFIIALSFV